MVGWWKFDESEGDTVTDSSGNGLDGRLVDGATVVSDAERGKVLSLDGEGDYVVVGSVGVDSNTPRTIAGWAKASSMTIEDWTNLFGFTDPTSANNRSFDIEHIGIAGTTYRGYGIHVHGWERNMFPVDLDWHHLAATYDGTTITWYGDGHLVGSEDRVLNTVDNVQMGKRADNPNCFAGLIDDVRIYSYALSQAEMAALYAGQGPGPLEKPKWLMDKLGNEKSKSSGPGEAEAMFGIGDVPTPNGKEVVPVENK
jgi:hypothetical protein